MTPDDVKRLLREYQPLRREMLAMQRTLRQLESDIDGASPTRSDGTPRGSGRADPVANAVIRLEMHRERLAAKVAETEAALQQIEALIALATDADGRAILRWRYIVDVRFDYIPARIGFTRRAMFYHYNRALREIAAADESLH